MDYGFFSVYRKIFPSPIFDNPYRLKVYIWCRGKAAFQEQRVVVNSQEIILKQGQFIYGRISAARELRMSESTVRNHMDYLLGIRHYSYRFQDRELDIEKGRNFSIITLRDEKYNQEVRQENGQKKDSYRTQIKKNKKDNKNIYTASSPSKTNQENDQMVESDKKINFNFRARHWESIAVEDIEGWRRAYPDCDIAVELERMKEWLISDPKRAKKNYRRFITSWLARNQKDGGTKSAPEHSRIGETRKRSSYMPDDVWDELRPLIRQAVAHKQDHDAVHKKLGRFMTFCYELSSDHSVSSLYVDELTMAKENPQRFIDFVTNHVSQDRAKIWKEI